MLGIIIGSRIGDRTENVTPAHRIRTGWNFLLLGALALATTVPAPVLWVAMAAIAPACVGFAGAIANLAAASADVVPAVRRGMGFALLQFMLSFAGATGPLIIGLVSDLAGTLRVGMLTLLPALVGWLILLPTPPGTTKKTRRTLCAGVTIRRGRRRRRPGRPDLCCRRWPAGAATCCCSRPPIASAGHCTSREVTCRRRGPDGSEERGIEDTAEAHFADIVRISFGTAETDLVRLAVEHAGETVDLLDAAGFSCRDSPRIVHGHEPYSVPRTYYGIAQGRSVLQVLERQLAASTAQVRLGARVTSLLVEDDVCVGVRIGEEEVRAASTVLCTGGFGADPDLFAELEGAPLVSAAAPTSTGDGLRLARTAGAAIVGQGSYIPTFGGLPPADGIRVEWQQRPRLVATERPPWEIYVDRAGRPVSSRRTSRPSMPRSARSRSVSDLTFWMIFDAEAADASWPLVEGWDGADLRQRA